MSLKGKSAIVTGSTSGIGEAITIGIVFRQADIALLGLAGFGLGCAEVVFSNAAQAILPALVPVELLPPSTADGLNETDATVGRTTSFCSRICIELSVPTAKSSLPS